MNKLVVAIIGSSKDPCFWLAHESAKGADAVLTFDGETEAYFFDKTNPNMPSIQKGRMLEALKKDYMGWWCLHIDADEVIEDVKDYVRFINESRTQDVYAVKMRHLVNNFRYEDATQQEHWTLGRLFKVKEGLTIPDGEHPVIQDGKVMGKCPHTVWHMAYAGGVWDVKKRYDGQVGRISSKTSHKKDFLDSWLRSHLFGTYPISEVKLEDLPAVLLKHFNIDPDEIYFANRNIEIKHAAMVRQWQEYFKPNSVLDLGCGKGPYLYFWKWFTDEVRGIELSEWAVKNAFTEGIKHGNVNNCKLYENLIKTDYGHNNNFLSYELITAIDILEHLSDEDLDKTLRNMSDNGYKFLFSIPFIGDPNLLADKTHVQHKTKEEWIKLIESYGIKIVPTPEHFYYKEQILIGRKE